MFSNKQEKLIRSLQKGKYRKQEELFAVEGHKLVQEALNSPVTIVQIYCTEGNEVSYLAANDSRVEMISQEKMQKISSMATPPGIIALLKTPSEEFKKEEMVLFLDGISDPGNMGTIIRTAEGFGINQLVVSPHCVELFSPKVVQASMGSIFRMAYTISEFSKFLSENANHYQFYSADMKGETIYEADLQLPGVLIMGSESHGVSELAKSAAIRQLSIPIQAQLESLNVAIANAIILSEFKRRHLL